MCHIVKALANVSWDIWKHATDVAYKAVSSLEGAGVFAVELFLTGDGQAVFLLLSLRLLKMLLNEVAPRPHNSGHHTIESWYTSQFEQHLQAVVGLPLGEPSMKTPAAVMYTILEMRKQQKMGHVTIVGPSMGDVEERLKSILKEEGSDCQAAGMVAALTPLPVIGVPMPRGVPVATVAINNAANAGLFAVRMMGIHDADLLARMSQYQEDTRNDVLRKAEKLEKDGWESYLNP
ncbi:phosphoribosylaminoimidazole carboxylase [Quercus suber]|uniref:phosphoribosylaminoimidazole carboxylase n=1 Tax=Quercus suber TaxID=58331 RepID=A0AAW0LAM9_QUESU